jgi:hypothetical protein
MQGKFDDAEEVYVAVDELVSESVGIGSRTSSSASTDNNNLFYAKFLGSMGAFFRASGRLEVAQACLKDALVMQKRSFSFGSTVILETLMQIAFCLEDKNELDVAKDSIETILLPFATDTLGPDHLMTHFLEAFHACTTLKQQQQQHNHHSHPELAHAHTAADNHSDADSNLHVRATAIPTPRSSASSRASLKKTVADALQLFKEQQLPDFHPWVLKLGGYV